MHSERHLRRAWGYPVSLHPFTHCLSQVSVLLAVLVGILSLTVLTRHTSTRDPRSRLITISSYLWYSVMSYGEPFEVDASASRSALAAMQSFPRPDNSDAPSLPVLVQWVEESQVQEVQVTLTLFQRMGVPGFSRSLKERLSPLGRAKPRKRT